MGNMLTSGISNSVSSVSQQYAAYDPGSGFYNYVFGLISKKLFKKPLEIRPET